MCTSGGLINITVIQSLQRIHPPAHCRTMHLMITELSRLRNILHAHHSHLAEQVADVIALARRDEAAAWERVNSDLFWGGVGSIVDYTMRDNVLAMQSLWEADVREMREILVELGEQLMARGNENPRIASWVLAFSNCNASNVV